MISRMNRDSKAPNRRITRKRPNDTPQIKRKHKAGLREKATVKQEQLRKPGEERPDTKERNKHSHSQHRQKRRTDEDQQHHSAGSYD